MTSIEEMADAIDKWQKENGILDKNFGGPVGILRLENMLYDMGIMTYLGDSEILAFLSHNPGAINALISWIIENNTEEWRKNLIASIPYEEENTNEK